MSERDVVSAPKPSTVEPPRQPGVSRIRYLRKIATWKPAMYEAILHAYKEVPQISGETLVNAREHTGDEAETELVDIILPPGLNKSFEIKRGDELLLVRPEIEEAIQVSPLKRPQVLPTSSTYTPNPVDNPYLQKPATDYNKAA